MDRKTGFGLVKDGNWVTLKSLINFWLRDKIKTKKMIIGPETGTHIEIQDGKIESYQGVQNLSAFIPKSCGINPDTGRPRTMFWTPGWRTIPEKGPEGELLETVKTVPDSWLAINGGLRLGYYPLKKDPENKGRKISTVTTKDKHVIEVNDIEDTQKHFLLSETPNGIVIEMKRWTYDTGHAVDRKTNGHESDYNLLYFFIPKEHGLRVGKYNPEKASWSKDDHIEYSNAHTPLSAIVPRALNTETPLISIMSKSIYITDDYIFGGGGFPNSSRSGILTFPKSPDGSDLHAWGIEFDNTYWTISGMYVV